MIEVAIMIEGQNGLNWQRWMRIARAAEDLGFAGLYRSDHFTNSEPPNLDSLDLWLSLTWLASNTQRIEFGPLVTPVSFRHPVFTARNAMQIDNLSGGRLQLGVGAGWQAREHEMFGFDLLETPARFARFEEGLQVISRLLKSESSTSFDGIYYRLNHAELLPKPRRPGGPPIVIGGNGVKYTLPLVACYADEWNGVLIPAEKFEKLNRIVDTYLGENEREPGSLRRTLMNGLVFGRNDGDLTAKREGRTTEELRQDGVLSGTGGQVRDQIGQLERAGVQRVMLQWLDLDDLDGLELFAKAVL